MEYRSYGRGSEKLSAVGLGGEYLEGLPEGTVMDIFDSAMEAGMNILDLYMSEPNVRSNIGKALLGRREKMYIQGHIGATWQHGQYTRDRNMDKTKAAFEDLLARLRTDYMDFGMIHYVDDEKDMEKVLSGGTFDYARKLKKEGVIRRIGLSSHNPHIARKFVETGEIDLVLFSINPAYDLDDLANENHDELKEFRAFQQEELKVAPSRAEFYALAERKGVAVTVMKLLGSATLLSASRSPFGKALTVPQCIQYALDRPGVTSALVGVKSVAEVKEALSYFDTPIKERDYSFILSAKDVKMDGRCMYCNHCLPCPSNIDIAAVNKFLDLAKSGEGVPDTVKDHYLALEAGGSDCIQCGSCEDNCPFGVEIRARMGEAVRVFGK